MLDRKNTLPWLVAMSLVSAALGQALVLSAAPHPQPVRGVPRVIAHRLAASLKPHLPARVLPPKAAID